jgi:hypothetical protein
MLRWSAGSLLAAGLWPGKLRSDGNGSAGDFHFLVVNDVHYFDEGCSKWLEGAIQQMKGHAEKPEFCLLVGDLAEHGKAEQIAPVRDIFHCLGMPTYVVVGNHDYRTPTDRTAFEKLFPQRINYRFEHKGWQFVALDTTQGQKSHGTSVQPPTLKWLESEAPKVNKKPPTVIFTHFPMGPWVIGRPINANRVLEPFKEHNLQAVFCGHWHGFTERHIQNVVLTTNRCCSYRKPNHDGTKEKGYFLCRARDGKVERRFVQVPNGKSV